MPAKELGFHQGEKLQVVACRDSSSTLSHVGLLARTGRIAADVTCEVLDMGPPLRVNPVGEMAPNVVAWMSLTEEEIESIEAWIADLATQTQSCSYCAVPAWEVRKEPTTNRVIGWRFSCAGFVFCAYQAADLRLLDEAAIPLVPYEIVRDGWIHIAKGDEKLLRAFLKRSGIVEPGPWPVMLPGYIVHALAADRVGLPLTPSAAQRAFPVEPANAPRVA